MGQKTVTCPSGLKGEIRNLKAREMSILANPDNGKNATAGKKKKGAAARKQTHPLDPIFRGCWLGTVDLGPYKAPTHDTAEPGAGVPWGDVVLADRTFLLIHIRDLTWGSYEFPVRCEDPTCKRHKKRFIWEIDLNDIETAALPAESLEKLRTGEPFEITLGGKRCTFRLQTGQDEIDQQLAVEEVEGKDKVLAQVAGRLRSVEGVDWDDAKARLAFIGDLDLPEVYEAAARMEEVDGGIETRTIVECPDCGAEFTVDIPFADGPFLAPPPTTAKKKTLDSTHK